MDEAGSASCSGEGDEQMMEDPANDPEASTVLQLSLHRQPNIHCSRIRFPANKTFSSSAAWCGKTNIIACATETCARDSGSGKKPTFWIPVHLVDPERPTEHAIFNVTADTPCDSIASIEWSPLDCQRALLVANSRGRVTIWTQPSGGPLNVARAFNCWTCEHAWRQDQAVVTKWISSKSSYQWTDRRSDTTETFEEKFLAHQHTVSARWPSFLCCCTVLASGVVELRWRQWPSPTTKWFCSRKGVLGAGPSGIYAADAIISESGALLVAGVPIGNPSTVVFWEISPGGLHGQQLIKLGASPWQGTAPLAAYLLTWHESPAESELEKEGPLLHCSPVSNLSAYISPEASTVSNLDAWGSGVVAVAFDPEKGGTALVVIVIEGQYMCPNNLDGGPSMTGWQFQRWESSKEQVVIHSLFESNAANYDPLPHPVAITWKAVVIRNFPQTKLAAAHNKARSINRDTEDFMIEDPKLQTEVLPVVKCLAKVSFGNHGGEAAVALLGGEVHIFSGPGLVPVENFCVQVGFLVATPSLSASGCCFCCAWHDTDSDTSFLKVVRFQSLSSAGPPDATLERQIADRFWWSLVTGRDWWDAVAYAQSAAEGTQLSLGAVAAALDADFHSLPLAARQHYGTALDRIKCKMLEGTDAADMRALVLDMQARLLLDVLGRGIEAAVVNPSTLILDPWQAPSETLTGLGGDAMLVDPALVQQIQAYVDVVLDLASHFLTRLRRYASFCQTLATGSQPASAQQPSAQPSASAAGATATAAAATATATVPATTPPTAQGNQANATSNGGNAQVQAWIQDTVAKISNPDGAASAPTPITVSTSTFPGIPAVRLVGDCYFLHKLCQLLLFCLVFRKRQLPRYIGGIQKPGEAGPSKDEVKPEDGAAAKLALFQPPKSSEDSRTSARLGSGNAGQGYTADEVKYLFLVLLDLCKRTAQLAHPLPKFPAGARNPVFRLHYIEGQFSVVPEIVKASLVPHMQNLPRPRGADAAGILMRELELHPPAEEWNKRILSGGSWCDNKQQQSSVPDHPGFKSNLWPRKRRFAERDSACGIETAVGLASFTGFMGSRRDVISSSWKSISHVVWHKCMRCGRQTASLLHFDSKQAQNSQSGSNSRDVWWSGRWAHSCPICGGHWIRIV